MPAADVPEFAQVAKNLLEFAFVCSTLLRTTARGVHPIRFREPAPGVTRMTGIQLSECACRHAKDNWTYGT